MKSYINTYRLLGFYFMLTSIYAQQNPEYTQYMYNTMVINPAYTGSTQSLDIGLLHRSQWVGIEGAPSTQTLTFHTPLIDDKIGLGLSVINDKLGPSNEFNFEGNFAYSVEFRDEKKIAFGLKAGLRKLDIDYTKGSYYNPIDPLLNSNVSNEIKPSLGAGVYYYTDRWYLGASVPNLVKGNFYDDNRNSIDITRIHYYFIGGYIFDFSESVKFKPAFLVKVVNGAPPYYILSANFLFNEKFTLGGSCQLNDSVSANAGFQISNEIFIGYSFDFTTTELNRYNVGTHEIILRYQFRKNTRQMRSPRFF